MEMISRIDPAYKPLYTSKKRNFLITGGRGSAKSFSVHDFVLRLTYERDHGILFTRYTMTSAETSIIPEFQEAIQRLGVESDFQVTKKDIVNRRTGSFIWFRGIKTSSGDQTANLKSLAGIDTWIVEEGEDFRDEIKFDRIDDSIRTKKNQNRVIFIMNSADKEHFVYSRWFKDYIKYIDIEGFQIPITTHPDVEHIHTTFEICKEYLSDDWLKKAERTKVEDPDWYAFNYLGKWSEQQQGAIYTKWKEGEFNEDIPITHGLDFGYDDNPDALVKVAVDMENKKIYAKEMMYQNGQSQADIIHNLGVHCGTDELIIADSNEGRLIDDIADAGFNIYKAQKGPDSVGYGIKVLQSFEIIVDPESQNLKHELNNYIWSDKRSGKPVKKNDHLLDALRYAVVNELKYANFVA